MKVLVLAAVLVAASARPQRETYQEDPRARQESALVDDRRVSTTTFIPIISWDKQQEHDGTYKASYETGNNILAEESGYIKNIPGADGENVGSLVQEGSYSYTSPDGQQISVRYTADETGFHAIGDHIPTPPPVSPEIQKGLDLIYEGIRLQQEAAAREAASKPSQVGQQSLERPNDKDRIYQRQ